MNLAEGLIAHLKSDATVADHVGDRIYYARRPQNVSRTSLTIKPRIADGIYDLDGEVGVSETFLDVNCYALGPSGASIVEEVYETLRALLSGFRGWWSDVEILGCTLESSGRVVELPPRNDSDLWTFWKILGLRIHYRQDRTTF